MTPMQERASTIKTGGMAWLSDDSAARLSPAQALRLAFVVTRAHGFFHHR